MSEGKFGSHFRIFHIHTRWLSGGKSAKIQMKFHSNSFVVSVKEEVAIANSRKDYCYLLEVSFPFIERRDIIKDQHSNPANFSF